MDDSADAKQILICIIAKKNGRDYPVIVGSSSCRMRVIYHNWSAMKQRPHPQSVAEISHHSVLSGGRIRQLSDDSDEHSPRSAQVS